MDVAMSSGANLDDGNGFFFIYKEQKQCKTEPSIHVFRFPTPQRARILLGTQQGRCVKPRGIG
jgi:hypothetical protein